MARHTPVIPVIDTRIANPREQRRRKRRHVTEDTTDILILGGGPGGVGSALACLGKNVILTEESARLGGD